MCVQDYENQKNGDYHHKIFTFLQTLNSDFRLIVRTGPKTELGVQFLALNHDTCVW